MKKAIFLDRDGVINIDKGYTHKIEDLKFENNAIEGLKLLQNKDHTLILLSNQAGIGRGFYTVKQYRAFMENMFNRLGRHGIKISKDYFCPHPPNKNCKCRKPETGMLEQAIRDFSIDISKSWIIGDKTSDIELGRRAGLRTILVRTGYAGKDGLFEINPYYTAKDLLDAARQISQTDSSKTPRKLC